MGRARADQAEVVLQNLLSETVRTCIPFCRARMCPWHCTPQRRAAACIFPIPLPAPARQPPPLRTSPAGHEGSSAIKA